jgi:hypothetical protein
MHSSPQQKVYGYKIYLPMSCIAHEDVNSDKQSYKGIVVVLLTQAQQVPPLGYPSGLSIARDTVLLNWYTWAFST